MTLNRTPTTPSFCEPCCEPGATRSVCGYDQDMTDTPAHTMYTSTPSNRTHTVPREHNKDKDKAGYWYW